MKPALEIKHGHGLLSKLGRNQCEVVAYKNWFRSGKWHNPWMSVTLLLHTDTTIQDGGYEILRRPWGLGTSFPVTARVRHFEFVQDSQTLAVSIEKPLKAILLFDKKIFRKV